MIFCIQQCLTEIKIFLKNPIYTATSIEQFEEAKAHLVFCDINKFKNHSATVDDLYNEIIG